MIEFWNGFQISVHCANLCMILHNHHGDSHANQDVILSTSGVYLRFHLTYADCIESQCTSATVSKQLYLVQTL